MTHTPEALQRALDAAARCHAIHDMGRGNVGAFDYAVTASIVRSFVGALPDCGEGLGVSPQTLGVAPADVAHFLAVFDALEKFEATSRTVRGLGAFPRDMRMPDPAVVRVVDWLRTLAAPRPGEGA